MLKFISLAILILACTANAQKFPITATSVLGGGIMSSNQRDAIIIFGHVTFIQESRNSPVVANVNITFFPGTDPVVNKPRGLHVHTFGISDLTNDPAGTCESAGPHWNPSSNKHGDLNAEISHEGDLGNVFVSPTDGVIFTQIISQKLKLWGPDSIIGRSVVLHETQDDIGLGGTPASLKTGNAGVKIACGTIGLRS